MEAIDAKKLIKEKLPNIAKTIASFMDSKNKEVEEKVLNIPFYIYQDNYLQKDRLTKVEIFSIAKEFAMDVLDKNNLKKENHLDMIKDIALFASESCFEEDYPDKEKIKNIVKKYKELSKNIDENVNQIEQVCEHTSDDYQVKQYLSKYYVSKENHEYIQQESMKIKRDLLTNCFGSNLNLENSDQIEKMWNNMLAFSTNSYDLTVNSEDYKQMIKLQRMNFYKQLGCKGANLEQLVKDAEHKNIIINSSICNLLCNEYNKKVYDSCAAFLKDCTNINEIYNTLELKGYTVNQSSQIFTFLKDNNLLGINLEAQNEDDLDTSYVIFNNNLTLSSNLFTETCIHEFLHHIGGHNFAIHKQGLYYDNDVKYLDLEEAYVNCLAKKITQEYKKEYGDILPVNVDFTGYSNYDKTLDYIKEVFKKYYKELNKIQLSDSITLKQANDIMPYTPITNSVTRIMRADNTKVEQITKEELDNLKIIEKEFKNKENRR